MMTFERDPEEVGPEHPDDLELRMDVQQSIHPFTPGRDGRCTEHLVRRGGQAVVCGSRDKWSVLHSDFDDDGRHDIECHCNECPF